MKKKNEKEKENDINKNQIQFHTQKFLNKFLYE